MKKEKVAITFQGLQPGETFSNKNPLYYRILFLKKRLKWNSRSFKSPNGKNPSNSPMLRVCHLLYPKTWWPELRCDQNIPKCYVREAGSLVETALKEDFVLFRESPKHGEAGIPSVQLRSMNWVTFNGSLSSDYLKSTVIMLLKSWAAWQDHLTVFFSVTLEFSTSERGLSVVHNLEDGSCVIYNICVSGKEMQASLLINKHTCVRTILGRPLFPEELISNIGKSWPSKTDLCFSVLMEVSAIWRLISGCSERQ